MKERNDACTVVPYPRTRLIMVDGGRLGLKRHTIHGLIEFDITDARESLRRHRKETGEALSFLAFFLACLGKAIDQNKEMHACRNWHRQMVIYDEVDVNMLFEVEVDGEKIIRPHIFRGVNKLSIREIHEEIRSFQDQHESSEEAKFIVWFERLPGFLRRLFLKVLLRTPRLVKDFYGTVMVSSIGMFGSGSGWGIPVPNHSLQLTLGGICDKPGVVDHRIEVRKYMSVTISLDHDVIDGAPAARFINRLKSLVEAGYNLQEIGDSIPK